jgi:RNA polymerase sigma factor (sigma-70 family)
LSDTLNFEHPKKILAQEVLNMQFLTLDEYLVGARKIMLKEKCGFLADDEDAVSHVAYRMMKADETWDGSSSRTTWRYNQAKYAILRLITQKKKEGKRKILSLDYGWDMDQDILLGDSIEDRSAIDVEDHLQFQEICQTAEELLKDKQLSCFKMHYLEGCSCAEIGRVLKCSRENVRQHLEKGIEKLKRWMLSQN